MCAANRGCYRQTAIWMWSARSGSGDTIRRGIEPRVSFVVFNLPDYFLFWHVIVLLAPKPITGRQMKCGPKVSLG
jgi:hypothetical protein